MTLHRLFGEFAHRFDLHTPPEHYRHDQEFVLGKLRHYPSGRLLDVGCGTGVLLRRARDEGFVARGIDVSPEMITVCEGQLGPGVATVMAMEAVAAVEEYDVVASLSWSFNYVAGEATAADVLRRFHVALRPGGTLILHVAHGPHATGSVGEDRESGPEGQPDDVLLLYRFDRPDPSTTDMRAQYVFVCRSAREMLFEEHVLHVADANLVARLAADVGFRDVSVLDSWRGDRFKDSLSPFIVGTKY